VGTRAGLDDVEKRKSCPCRDSNCNHLVVQPVANRYTGCTINSKFTKELDDNHYIILLRNGNISTEFQLYTRVVSIMVSYMSFS
jgi:hypothetical protein